MKKVNIFIWCSKHQILYLLNYFKNIDCGFEILIWCKTNPSPTTNNIWLPDIEYCLYFREKGVPLNDGYELKSKWYQSPINKNDKDKYNHPTIKPIELVKRHLLHTTQTNDIVLDCFSGSGTTCVAAKELGRQFIGIEIDPEYHKISLDRINGILANGQISFDTDICQIGGK
jgi:DNA modification methylase